MPDGKVNDPAWLFLILIEQLAPIALRSPEYRKKLVAP
jgi:hypothetical protein